MKTLAIAALAFASVSVSAQVLLPEPATIPIDSAARAKFPAEPASVVDAIAYVNRYVNEHIQGVSDQEHYGIADLWVMFPSDNKGDCEDYALTKLGFLEMDGFPGVTNSKIVPVIAHLKNGDEEGHGILAILLPKGGVMYLDNLRAEPATRAELEAAGYQFFDWKA